MIITRRSLPILCVAWFALGAAFAQQTSTVPVTIVVTDPSGAGVPTANVRVVPAPDPSFKLQTDSKGRLALNLKPGGYALFVSLLGFRKVVTHFDVHDAKEGQTVPISLRIGGGSSVEVEPPRSKDDLELLMYPYTQRALLSGAELKSMPHIALTFHNPHTNADEAYSGVRLSEILTKFGAPVGKELHGEALAIYVVAHGSDGYEAVLSLAEVDPTFHPGEVLVADSMNGKPLDEHNGPLKLVVAEDKRPARAVRNLVTIQLESAQ
jgi:hypothetical protein